MSSLRLSYPKIPSHALRQAGPGFSSRTHGTHDVINLISPTPPEPASHASNSRGKDKGKSRAPTPKQSVHPVSKAGGKGKGKSAAIGDLFNTIRERVETPINRKTYNSYRPRPTISKSWKASSVTAYGAKAVRTRVAELAKAHLVDILVERDPTECEEANDLDELRRAFVQEVREHVDKAVAVRLETLTQRCEDLQRERDDYLELAARNYWLLEDQWQEYYADKPKQTPPRSITAVCNWVGKLGRKHKRVEAALKREQERHMLTQIREWYESQRIFGFAEENARLRRERDQEREAHRETIRLHADLRFNRL